MCSKDRSKIANSLTCYIVLETDYLTIPLKEFLHRCYDGGARIFQLRNKDKTVRENFEIGKLIKSTLPNDAFFIVNDRVDLAIALEADGVHLGKKDIPPETVKTFYPNLLIGYSVNNERDIKYANSISADYIGIGPAFQTDTKKDLRPILSDEAYINLLNKTNIPAVAIGGITTDNLHRFSKIPVKGVAISSHICKSQEPEKIVKKILDFFHERNNFY